MKKQPPDRTKFRSTLYVQTGDRDDRGGFFKQNKQSSRKSIGEPPSGGLDGHGAVVQMNRLAQKKPATS